MGKKRVSKGKIIQKKEQKIQEVVDSLGNEMTEDAFVQRFKEMFPDDWLNIKRRYEAHEHLSRPGKVHPMPKPEKYLQNIFNVYINKNKLND